MTPIINSRADLDALAGTPAHAEYLTMLNGSLTDGPAALLRYGFTAETFAAELAATGLDLTPPALRQPPPPPTLDERRTAMRGRLAARRYAAEVAGFDFRGARIFSDQESQSAIAGAWQAAQLVPGFGTAWKCQGNAWLQLDEEGLRDLFLGVVALKAGCFAREHSIAAQIDAATTDADFVAIAAELDVFSPAQI